MVDRIPPSSGSHRASFGDSHPDINKQLKNLMTKAEKVYEAWEKDKTNLELSEKVYFALGKVGRFIVDHDKEFSSLGIHFIKLNTKLNECLDEAALNISRQKGFEKGINGAMQNMKWLEDMLPKP